MKVIHGGLLTGHPVDFHVMGIAMPLVFVSPTNRRVLVKGTLAIDALGVLENMQIIFKCLSKIWVHY